MTEKKPFYLSKTKMAGILGALYLALPGLISWLNGGNIPFQELSTAIIALLGAFGIRDALDKKE